MYVCTLALILAPLACGGDGGATGSSPAVTAACEQYAKCGGSKSECFENMHEACTPDCESALMALVNCQGTLPCTASEEEAMAQCGAQFNAYNSACEGCVQAQHSGDDVVTSQPPPDIVEPGDTASPSADAAVDAHCATAVECGEFTSVDDCKASYYSTSCSKDACQLAMENYANCGKELPCGTTATQACTSEVNAMIMDCEMGCFGNDNG